MLRRLFLSLLFLLCHLEATELPETHQLQKLLPTLFTDAQLFDSPESLREAGFEVNPRVHKGLMVFTHPKIKKYIFKKYQNEIDHERQISKYKARLEGAQKIRHACQKYGLKHIVVPNKWLYRLPKIYGDDEYLVVAERLKIVPGDDKKNSKNIECYHTMSYEVLQELCLIMKVLGGCDAWPRNQPFTVDGKIAFIDTEHVGQKPAHFAKHVLPLLPPEKQAYALTIME